ncbi:PD-(D/E)XK nuclease family protein [Candidatus Wolfebacteria bacterium]|nr:PD-(D/E)XK nuclease family protein [Candidatus Wolfebacteria bacterium]
MSKYYNPKKTRNLFDKDNKEPFVISRSGVDLFSECPRCFFIDKKLGTSRPPGYPFSLNNAVDALLKKEFDSHRADGIAHPLMEAYGIDAVPYPHEELEKWRESRTAGIRFFHEPTNLILRGGIDDIWINSKGELHIVDYKATSKNEEVNLDADWQIGYKRQVEVYQWLFRQNGFKVSDIAYFVYCNGLTDREAFDAKLEFDVKVIPYNGDDSWVEGILKDIKKCLKDDKLPESGRDCDYCAYFKARGCLEKEKSA